jgi:hypothetical protein
MIPKTFSLLYDILVKQRDILLCLRNFRSRSNIYIGEYDFILHRIRDLVWLRLTENCKIMIILSICAVCSQLIFKMSPLHDFFCGGISVNWCRNSTDPCRQIKKFILQNSPNSITSYRRDE